VDAVEVPESGCNPNATYTEKNGQISAGLLSMSIGDSVSGVPGACQLNSANAVFNPQLNLNCGVAKMNQLSVNGISNSTNGMAEYWSVLNINHSNSTLSTIEATAANYPGCH
jgi:hypothetical protein